MADAPRELVSTDGQERPFERELDRIRGTYAVRASDPSLRGRYDPLKPAALFRDQGRQWVVADLLRRSGLATLAGLDILDIGCGAGLGLERLIGLGATPERLSGIDLMPDRVTAARQLVPQARIEQGSAHALPFLDASFDIVVQLVVFSSVVDPGLQRAIAGEMRRVLRPGGRILWYEACAGPRTSDFVPIPHRRLGELFPGAGVISRRCTLRWWLLERAAPRSRLAAATLERVPALCSHEVAVLTWPDRTEPGGPL